MEAMTSPSCWRARDKFRRGPGGIEEESVQNEDTSQPDFLLHLLCSGRTPERQWWGRTQCYRQRELLHWQSIAPHKDPGTVEDADQNLTKVDSSEDCSWSVGSADKGPSIDDLE